MSTNKFRNWAFLIYPESCPENWRVLLSNSGVKAAVSPLHDRDINEDGTKKKPHYHIMFCFDGPITQVRANLFSATFNGTIAIPVDSLLGMYKYLTHKNNPEKAQYLESDITLYNGFDPTTILSSHEIVKIKQAIQIYIIEHNIFEYSVLCDSLCQNPELFDWYYVATTNTTFFNAYLKSRHFHHKEMLECIKNA